MPTASAASFTLKQVLENDRFPALFGVERTGIEPVTSGLQAKRKSLQNGIKRKPREGATTGDDPQRSSPDPAWLRVIGRDLPHEQAVPPGAIAARSGVDVASARIFAAASATSSRRGTPGAAGPCQTH